MISSLDGNDVFSMSRKYQQKYQDELTGYIDVTPPLLLNITGVTIETGTSSFKEFMMLFEKIYQGSNSIVAKRQLDPNAKLSSEARAMELKAYKDGLDFKTIKSSSMSHTRTIRPLFAYLEAQEIKIALQEDYLLRKGMFDTADTQLGEWITLLEQQKPKPSTERKEHIETVKERDDIT